MGPETIICCLSAIQIELGSMYFNLLHLTAELESSGQGVPEAWAIQCGPWDYSFDMNPE